MRIRACAGTSSRTAAQRSGSRGNRAFGGTRSASRSHRRRSTLARKVAATRLPSRNPRSAAADRAAPRTPSGIPRRRTPGSVRRLRAWRWPLSEVLALGGDRLVAGVALVDQRPGHAASHLDRLVHVVVAEQALPTAGLDVL